MPVHDARLQLAVVRYRMRLLRITLAQMPRHSCRDIAGVVVTTAVLVTIVVTKFAAVRGSPAE